jgi:hypothetical protein
MRRPLLIAISVVAFAGAGCGGFGGGEITSRVTETAVLTKAQVDRQPADSPQRAVFEWWRAMQFKNPIEAAQYFSASLHMTPARMSRYIQGADSSLQSRPHLVDAQISGDDAIVRLMLERVTKNPNGRVDRERKPQGFNLVHEEGGWKLSDNLYLAGLYKTYRAFTAPLREKGNAQK